VSELMAGLLANHAVSNIHTNGKLILESLSLKSASRLFYKVLLL